MHMHYARIASKRLCRFVIGLLLNEPIVEPEVRIIIWYWYFVKNYSRARASTTFSLAHALGVREYRRAKQCFMFEDSRIGPINCFAPPYQRESIEADSRRSA